MSHRVSTFGVGEIELFTIIKRYLANPVSHAFSFQSHPALKSSFAK